MLHLVQSTSQGFSVRTSLWISQYTKSGSLESTAVHSRVVWSCILPRRCLRCFWSVPLSKADPPTRTRQSLRLHPASSMSQHFLVCAPFPGRPHTKMQQSLRLQPAKQRAVPLQCYRHNKMTPSWSTAHYEIWEYC